VPEPLRLWSVTSLEKIALGKSEGVVKHGKKTIAGIAFDKIKTLSAFVEDKDRPGAVKYLLDQEWAGVKKAAARGTDLHRAAEKLALGLEPEIEEHNRPFLDQFVRFLEEIEPEYAMSEAPCYHLRYGYAGTCDGIVLIDGQRVLFDIKTTQWGKNDVDENGRPRSRPPFDEHVLQICAYRHAELVGLLSERVETNRGRYYAFDPGKHTEPMPETDGAVCLVISPKDWELVPVRSNDEVFRAWLAVLELARFKEETMKVAVGPPLTPAKQEVAA
jgi:hypothetical protein